MKAGSIRIALAAVAIAVLSAQVAQASPPGPALGPGKDALKQDDRIPGHYIVVLKDSVAHPGAVAEAQTENQDGELGFVYRHALKGYSAELSKSAVEALRRNPKVKSVTPDYEAEAFSQTIPTGVQRTFDTENETADIDGEDTRVNVDVAVIDTGVDHTHSDLNAYKRTNCVPAGEDLFKEGAVEECIDSTGTDLAGHGTHVAGTIGALDNGEGVVGIAPGARIWSVRVLGKDGSGSFSWIIAGIDWVTTHAGEIEVANMSLGCTGFMCFSPPMEEAIDASIEAGVVYTVAAGNSGENANGTIPAVYPDVITVAALADTDGKPGAEGSEHCHDNLSYEADRTYVDDSLAYFSNWGSVIDLVAPGGCILSTAPEGKYASASGTSMAAPHIAGAAALLASKSNPNSKKDVEAIRNQLVEAGSLAYEQSLPGPPSPVLYLGDKVLAGTETLTGGAQSIASLRAQITGAIDPRSLKTEYWFEYGTSTEYGKTTPVKELPTGSDFSRAFETLTSLQPLTSYHFRLVAKNTEGTFPGKDHVFTTNGIAFTTLAGQTNETEATLNGAFYVPDLPAGTSATTYSFEYGLTADYGKTVAAELDESEYSELIYGEYEHATKPIAGLDKGSTYHYRLVATNSVGTFYGNDQRFRTTIWSPGAQVPKPEEEGFLRSISCVASNNCMALAYPNTEQWNGESWKAISRPHEDSRGYGELLEDVSCTSSNACMAVGWSGECTGIVCTEKGHEQRPVAMRWNGEVWTRITTPIPAGSKGAYLEGVSCTSSSNCIAVGTYAVVFNLEEGSIRDEYLAMHWDGEKWTLLSMPEAPSGAWTFAEMHDVSCGSASDCIAVGNIREAMHWDGSKWSRISMPSGIEASAVSCASPSACLAVGHYGSQARARRWDGKEWSTTPVGELGKTGAYWVHLTDVSCVSAWSCAAVGNSSFLDEDETWKEVGYPVATRWDGTEWSAERVSERTGEEWGSRLGGVACTSASHCTAVGSDLEGALVDTYDYATSPPSVTSESASGLDGHAATLNAGVNGGSLLTSYQFEYDTAPYKEGEGNHGTSIPVSPKNIGASGSTVKVSQALTGLTSKTTYHYRLVASNAEGTTYGKDTSFTTPAAVPHVATKAATSVTASGATLTGSVDPYGLEATYHFEYDITPYKEGEGPHGTSVPVPGEGVGSGTEVVPVSEAISGLKAATTYHYRVVAGNSEGTAYGTGETFTTWGTWSLQTPSTPKVAEKSSLAEVSCVSSTWCATVGYDEYARRQVAQKWDGEKWSLLEGTDNRKPTSISCALNGPFKQCFAVGEKTEGGHYTQQWSGSPGSEIAPAAPEGGTLSALNGVSCKASYACTLVGSYTKEGKTKPLAERYNAEAGSWSVQTPATSEGVLRDVNCASSTECIAVGKKGTLSAPEPLIERWNGTSWSALSSPLPGGASSGSLNKVSCSSSSSCLATGAHTGSTPYVVRWDGKEWTLSSSGLSSAPSSDLSCTSSTACIAVGAKEGKTLMQSWNGGEWAAQSSPNPEGKTPAPTGVSCTSSTACIAVGKATFGEGGSASFGERYNGTWSLQTPATPKVAEKSSLAEVSCVSSTWCAAVGYDEYSRRQVAQKWDGEKWNLLEGADNRKPTSISCALNGTFKQCFAVGGKTEGGYYTQQWLSSPGSEIAPAAPEGGTLSALNGVSCKASYACTLVGSYTKEGKTKPLAERYNAEAGSWSVQTPATSEGVLRDVSCASSTECIAVGKKGAFSAPAEPLIERWNGTSWSALSSPLPSGSTNGSLSRVACSSTTSCLATGATSAGTLYAVRWDGKEWTLASSGLQASSDLACTSSTACIAVGAKEGKTLMQVWNGSEWAAQSSPNPEGKTPAPSAVSCSSVTACIAVGSATFGSGESAAFAERYG